MIKNFEVIVINHLSFSYDRSGLPVINDFSCQIPLGSRVVILGLNGSGKSTLLNLVLGFLDPMNGEIFLNTKDKATKLSDLDGAVGYLPQIENIPFDYRVSEYILLGRIPFIDLFSNPGESDTNFVMDILELLKMSEFYGKRLREISGGELQRVRLARVLAQNPKIILMDEPATHLDIKNKRSLYKTINELSEKGTTLIFSSHDPFDIEEISDYCILMNKSLPTRLFETRKLKGNQSLSRYFEVELNIGKNKK
jgi:ABC-type cobalamin/Fe3+-siderophores transport system ATPase subunit